MELIATNIQIAAEPLKVLKAITTAVGHRDAHDNPPPTVVEIDRTHERDQAG